MKFNSGDYVEIQEEQWGFLKGDIGKVEGFGTTSYLIRRDDGHCAWIMTSSLKSVNTLIEKSTKIDITGMYSIEEIKKDGYTELEEDQLTNLLLNLEKNRVKSEENKTKSTSFDEKDVEEDVAKKINPVDLLTSTVKAKSKRSGRRTYISKAETDSIKYVWPLMGNNKY